MALDKYCALRPDDQGARKGGRACQPLGGLLKSSLASLSRCWRIDHEDDDGPAPCPSEKKYVHVPTHAASSFLKTTTTRGIAKANEVL